MIIYLGLITLCVLMIYQIRLSRRISAKLRNMSKSERDPLILSKRSREENWQHYRQSEYFAQLINLMDFKATIPGLRSWAASADVLLTLLSISKRIKPKVVLDLGSGISTLVLAKATPSAKVFSIDHLQEFAGKTRSLLQDHDITNVDLRVAPLKPLAGGSDWYDISALSDIDQIDLLFIDGPPGSKDDTARHPVIEQCLSKLSPKAVIVLDDANREGERDLAEMFLKALPGYELEFLSHEKGTAVLKPR
ncbi:MAG: methyltransferase domain-containing protein [Candidatus Planktophila sp.]|nr:methyltransferase domain-containing protein [Candidatus Planktophila sp.]